MSRTGTLAFFLQRNSCLRRPSTLRKKEGAEAYKKGWEMRIVVESAAELTQLRRLLRRSGQLPAKAYRKRNKWIQPVYGREAVKQLSAQIGT
jgi:hypothetical protein